ncbi:hypothetical protein ACQKQD_03615 [Methylobacterium sp. NPDC080182]|uniref:hypothetical protein n=1 Tax=Methylobacterium sp. NPDC080182 TaxID=3390590 RepID=UPI003CFF2AF7
MASSRSQLETVGDLLHAGMITRSQLDVAIEAFIANPKIGAFELAPGCVVDLTAAVKADRHATATFKEPTAKAGSRRAAIRSALQVARPI